MKSIIGNTSKEEIKVLLEDGVVSSGNNLLGVVVAVVGAAVASGQIQYKGCEKSC